MAVTEAQVRAAFQVVSQASSVEQANELLGSELAPLFNQGASGEGFSEFESPAGDPIQIGLAFPKVTFETSVSGVAAGRYGSSTQVPVVTVDKYGRVLDVTLADIGEAGPTGPASGDLSGAYPAPTVSGLSGHALPALGATSGGLRWTGASWVVDSAAYAPYLHSHDYLPTNNPAFTGTLSGPNIRVSSLASSFVKSDSLGNLVNGAISVSDLPAHTHAYLPIANPTFTGTLTGPTATLTEFGKLQSLVGDSSYAAIYGTGVTPSGSNYLLRFDDSGSSAVLNASTALALGIGGASKLGVTTSEVNLASGVVFKMSATTVIDSSRNITGASLKATGLVAATVRPATIGADGLLGAQDPAAFLGTIGAAPSSHTHPYLPIANPTYTGRLTGPTQHLEADEQILLAIRRPGGQSGRIHGISFMAQDSTSAWVEFGRVMTYISSVTAGAHTGGMRLMAYKDGAILQALEAGPDGVTFNGTLSGPRATLTEFGTLRDRVGNPAFGALYAAGVTPATANYALAMTDAGTETYLGASDKVVLVVGGTSKLTVDADEANLASGVALKMAAITVIDSSRNITGTSLKATGLASAAVRPATIGTDGLLGAQDPAVFLGTIGAAPSSHTHPYLPIANPTFMGVLTGPTAAFTNLTATGNPVFGTSAAWCSVTLNSAAGTVASINLQDAGVVRATMQLYTGGAWRVVARDTGGVEIDSPFYVDLVAGGKLTLGGTARTTNFKGAIEIGATTVIDASRNITGTTVKSLNAAGTGIRPAVALADGTFDDQDAATFLSTIGAAAAIHDHTSITGSAAKLTTARSIGITGDGTWSVSFDGSANASGAMTLASIIAAGGPVGSATRAPIITYDSKGRLTAVSDALITPAWSSITSKPTTFSGLGVTMLASDIPNHASRHHWDGADPLAGQSIAGLRTTSSPTFYNLNVSEGIYFPSNSNSISTSLSDTIFRTDGTVRFRISPVEIRSTIQLSAPLAGFDNLSGGGNVRANSSGQLVIGSLLESELPAHSHNYLPISNPAFFGSLSGPSASFTGLVSASSFHASSNGLGENFRVGDDLWIGDVNLSHTALLKGYSDPTRAFLKFGTSGPVFGSNGSVFSISHLTGSTSRLVTVSSGGELGATSWANDGPWLPLSGAARVSGWVAFDAAVYSTSTIGFSGYTLRQLSIEFHTGFSFTGAAVSFLSAVSFGSSVQSSNSFSFLPVSQTATLGAYGSNKASIPSTSTTVYLEQGTGYQYRNYSAPILPDGQIQIYYGMHYGAPINPPQLFAAPDHAIYDARGVALASPSSAVSVFGVMIVQALGGDLFVLNRGDLT